MRKVGHFLGGREVYGTSRRFGEVCEPTTCNTQVALACESDHREVEQAKAAQPEWLQRGAHVLMKILELISRLKSFWRTACARTRQALCGREGRVQRGVEVAESAGRIAHLMRSAYSESAGAEHAG
jgi:malonate-semialdehyde dehydrogenase (acetylating)/methylmalonate-semialdehyde dehydrogenase